MLTLSLLDPHKKAIIFELDDVLYPQQDYLLQVYYLFANFLEYTETVPPANKLVEFMKNEYLANGPDNLFQKASSAFSIDPKYQENFNRMHVSAQLPLLLYLYPSIFSLLTTIAEQNKSIFILTKGNPLMQLNKIKYIDWQGLDKKLKVYFYDEIKLLTNSTPLQFILAENQLAAEETLFVGTTEKDEEEARNAKIDYLNGASFLK